MFFGDLLLSATIKLLSNYWFQRTSGILHPQLNLWMNDFAFLPVARLSLPWIKTLADQTYHTLLKPVSHLVCLSNNQLSKSLYENTVGDPAQTFRTED